MTHFPSPSQLLWRCRNAKCFVRIVQVAVSARIARSSVAEEMLRNLGQLHQGSEQLDDGWPESEKGDFTAAMMITRE